jgi:transposase
MRYAPTEQAIERVRRCIVGQTLSVSEIANRIGMSKSYIYQCLNVLQSRYGANLESGYRLSVEKIPETCKTH